MPGLSPPALDDTDLAILDALGADARATYGEVGTEVGLSAPAVKRRMDRLAAAGVIRGYTVELDHALLGRPLQAFTELRFSGHAQVDAIAADIPEVERVFTIAGDPDALVWLRARDVRDLKRVVDRLRGAGDVIGTRTMIVLDAAAAGPAREDGSDDDVANARPEPGQQVVDAALRLVTTLASATIDNADGVSVTLERQGRLMTVAASNDKVLRMDGHQYDTGEGPCLSARADGHPYYIESLDAETRWPAFTPLALEQGIHSILSSPLLTAGRPLGALNIYSNTSRAFDDRDQELAELFATQASDVLTRAHADGGGKHGRSVA